MLDVLQTTTSQRIQNDWQSENDICQEAGTLSACYSKKNKKKNTYSTFKCIVTTAYMDQSNMTTA